MFKGKVSFLKNLGYLLLLGLHVVIFIYFLLGTYLDYIPTILTSTSFINLVGLVLYSFLKSKTYYYYFYFYMIISSIPFILAFPISGYLIVPECIIIIILLLDRIEREPEYYKMRVNKNGNAFHFDPGVGVNGTIAFRMNEIWHPDNSIPLKSKDKKIESKTSKRKMQVIGFLITMICVTFSLISELSQF